ncbi:HEAT repeat domain-containing protein [Sulfidibacter corallicola]|uniref:HEAT repeat domain-containing protein n=1 Tax=Sulfidibacter corallicola TaxID=2818388 RepID=A0A8A4TH02_SULCO|nr:hypothetical protein [Sulfidibacter corallicola]QTD48913.1 HEAT repeat domain-containing protein [Sulfidibacter corallicola]
MRHTRVNLDPHQIAYYHLPWLRTTIVKYIGRPDDERVLGFLFEVLSNGRDEECMTAAQLLGEYGDFATIERLAKVWDRARFGFRRALDRAISKIQAKEQVGDRGWVSMTEPSPEVGHVSLLEAQPSEQEESGQS